MTAKEKGRSVVTDFGASPSRGGSKPAGKQARPRHPSESSGGESAPPRSRPPTTEAMPPIIEPVSRRVSNRKLPGAAVADAHYGPGYDQSRLYAHGSAQSESPTTVNVREESLRTRDKRLHLIHSPDSEQSAAFRVLRHQVEAADKPQVIAVTSAEDGAGKTTVAINLALALSECGRARVLFVEANYRRPTVAKMFKFSPQACFGDQVDSYHQAPGSAWHVTSMPACHLHIAPLARGRAPSPLLDGPAFRYAVAGLRGANYDHIVIDCCSVLAGADVNLVQDAADGVLLVARARVTTARQIRRAIERLTPSHLLGTTLIGG